MFLSKIVKKKICKYMRFKIFTLIYHKISLSYSSIFTNKGQKYANVLTYARPLVINLLVLITIILHILNI